MPELPEVETIKRQLEKFIVGKRIKSVEILNPRFIDIPVKKFQQAIERAKIKKIRRRAKLLIIDLSNKNSLLIHLKMTGQIIFLYPQSCRTRFGISSEILKQVQDDKEKSYSKHTHIIYNFANGSRLIHNDVRKFGYVKLVKTEEIEESLAGKFGPEPLDKDFTLPIFKNILAKKPRQKIKQFLMEQKNIAGIGNLYADEICFFAGVRPIRIIFSLTENEIKKIFTGIKKILFKAIKYHGSSVDNYLDTEGKKGEYHLRLKVYGRAGQPCKKCNAKIQKIRLVGRAAHFCPRCQK